jgi:hypothetical protein
MIQEALDRQVPVHLLLLFSATAVGLLLSSVSTYLMGVIYKTVLKLG